MNIDSGTFQALTDELADVIEEVERIKRQLEAERLMPAELRPPAALWDLMLSQFSVKQIQSIVRIFHSEENAARRALTRGAKRRRRRPRYLQLVSDDTT